MKHDSVVRTRDVRTSTSLVVAFVAFSWCAAVAAGVPRLSANAVVPRDASSFEPNGAVCGSITITQSSTQTITAGDTVSCNRGTSHDDNSYFRAFDLASLGAPDGLDVCEVQFGVESASAGSGSQPVTVNLYTSDPLFPSGFPGSLTLIGTTTTDVPDSASGSIVSVPITGAAPAGSQLVVEVFTPDGLVEGNLFLSGANPDATSGRSYLSAADCGVTNPTDMSELALPISFPDVHIVLNAIGNPPKKQACGSITITQSSSQTITSGDSAACTYVDIGTSTADNSYFRAFDLASLGAPDGLDVCEVQFGVESASAGSGSQPVTINLYTSDPLFPSGFPGSLTPIGTTTTDVPDSASGSIVSVPITGAAPAGSQLVVEVFSPNGTAENNLFYIGANTDAQSGPSYLRAADCGIPNPTDMSAIGFPGVHIVLNAIGNPPGPQGVIFADGFESLP